MAEHNNLAFFPQLGKGVVRVLGLGQDESGTTRVSETLYPIADLWGPTQHEWRLARSERSFGVRGTTPIAPALRFASLQFQFLANAGELVLVLERLLVSAQVTVEIAFNPLANPVNLTTSTWSRDSRFSNPAALTTSNPRALVRYGDVAALNAPTFDTLGAGDFQIPGFVYVTDKNNTLTLNVVQVTVASQFSFCALFRERAAFPGEITIRG